MNIIFLLHVMNDIRTIYTDFFIRHRTIRIDIDRRHHISMNIASPKNIFTRRIYKRRNTHHNTGIFRSFQARFFFFCGAVWLFAEEVDEPSYTLSDIIPGIIYAHDSHDDATVRRHVICYASPTQQVYSAFRAAVSNESTTISVTTAQRRPTTLLTIITTTSPPNTSPLPASTNTITITTSPHGISASGTERQNIKKQVWHIGRAFQVSKVVGRPSAVVLAGMPS